MQGQCTPPHGPHSPPHGPHPLIPPPPFPSAFRIKVDASLVQKCRPTVYGTRRGKREEEEEEAQEEISSDGGAAE